MKKLPSHITKYIQWFSKYSLTVFFCASIIPLGVVLVAYSFSNSSNPTTIKDNSITTENLNVLKDLTTKNLSVTGEVSGIPISESLGSYSAIVYKEGNKIFAKKRDGSLIAEGVVGRDDARVINSAINSLSDYGVVLLLEKIFTLSSSIVLKNNIWLRGVGFATVLKVADGADCHAITGTDVSNVILSDFLIDGNKANQTVGVHGIRIYADTQDNENIILQNIMVKNVKGHGIVLTGSGSHYNLNCIAGNIIALDNDSYGISYYYVKQGHMFNILAKGNTEGGVQAKYGEEININNIRSYNNRRGLAIGATDNPLTDVNIVNCHLNSNSGPGLCIFPQATDCQVSNVVAKNNQRYGIRNEADGVRMSNCICNNNKYDGIILLNASKNKIINCTCNNNTRYGIRSYGTADYNQIKNCEAVGNTSAPMEIDGIHDTVDITVKSSVLDLSDAATDIEVFHAVTKCQLVGYAIVYTEASSADAGVQIRIGRYRERVALDNDYFDSSTSEASKNKGYVKHFKTSNLSHSVINAGDTITVGTAGRKKGAGEVMLILKIAEVSS